MATVIWKKSRPAGTSKSRYKARRAELQKLLTQEELLARRIARSLAGCSLRVLKAISE
ncbi:hypothetical protein [Erwinia sp.]|uniref:hypothetical protein n=1 Tax=Erwinia citreus TaxID=558 RepID=UPI0028982002|nr:hypothetical protein [Erwinia sp.]